MVMQKGALFEKLDVNGGGGGGSVDYNRVVEKTAAELPTPTAELAGKAYMYVGTTDFDKNLRNGGIYECTTGTTNESVEAIPSGDFDVYIADMGKLKSGFGLNRLDKTIVLTRSDTEEESVDPLGGEDQGVFWSITDKNAFLAAVHNTFPNVDFFDATNPVTTIALDYANGAWTSTLYGSNWEPVPGGSAVSVSDISDYSITIDGDLSQLQYYYINTVPQMARIRFWVYGGQQISGESLYVDYGIEVWNSPENGDTITINYTAPKTGYIWKPVDLKYLVMPSLLEYTNDVVQYLGFDTATYKRGRFYKCVNNGDTPAEYTIQQTEGTTLSGLGMGSEPWKFGEQLSWPSNDVDVVFKFIGATQTTGNVTYNLTNIQATIDLNTFYSALSEITTVDMANMYKPEYATDGWQIAVKDPNDNWSIIAQSQDPAHWGITITSGTPVAWQDSIEVYFTALGVEQWEEYIDGTLFKSVPAKEWGIVYEGTPSAGVELEGHYTPGHVNVTWTEAVVQLAPSYVVTLAAANWDNGEQFVSVDVEDIDSKTVFVSPTPSSTSDYVAAGILCVEQAWGGLKFTCTSAPLNDIDVNVVVL